MKTRHLFWALPVLMAGLLLFGSASHRAEPARYFIITYTTGPAWNKEKEPQDQPYFKEHSAFLKELKSAKKSHIGARYADKGIVIFSAKDEAEAKQILSGDASVTNGTFHAQLDELYLFQTGCVE